MQDKELQGYQGRDEDPAPALVSEEPTAPESHVKSALRVLVSGMALVSDGYNVQIASYMNTVMQKMYKAEWTTDISTRLSNSVLVGDIFGMVLFGLFVDFIGRRVGLFLTTGFIVVGAVLAAAAHGTTATGMLWMIIICRGFQGVGCGGEYAVCASQAIEASNETTFTQKRRGLLFGMSTNTALNFGYVVSGFVSVIIVKCYHENLSEGIWRIAFAIGAVIPLVVFAFRFSIQESTQFKRHRVTRRRIPYWLTVKRYWRPVLGSAGGWFLYDMIVYPYNTLAPTIVTGFAPNQSLSTNLLYTACLSLAAFAGSFLGGPAMDLVGRKWVYVGGLFLVGVFAFATGGAYDQLQNNFAAFAVLFAIQKALLSGGPGNGTFMTSVDSVPTAVRGHFIGFSAACGKAGAALGTSIFPLIVAKYPTKAEGYKVMFLVAGAICVFASVMVYFCVPLMQVDLQVEDLAYREYLEAHGWDTSSWGEEEQSSNGPEHISDTPAAVDEKFA